MTQQRKDQVAQLYSGSAHARMLRQLSDKKLGGDLLSPAEEKRLKELQSKFSSQAATTPVTSDTN